MSPDRRHHPPRGPRLVLRVGRAARRPGAARPAGHRRRRRRARGELRGQGVRRAHGDGRRPGAAAVPGRRRRAAPLRRLHRGQPGRVRGVRGHDAARRGHLDRRGVPRRRRPAPHRRQPRRTSPPGCAPTCASASGWPSPSASPARSSSPRWRARSAKPDGLLVVPPDGELGVPAPAADRAGVGRRRQDGRQAPRPRHRHGRRHGPRSARARSSRSSAATPAATSTRSPTNRDPRHVERAPRRRSIGSQHALGRRRRTPAELDAVLVGIVDRVTRRLRARRARRPHGHAALPLRRLHAGHPLAHDARADRRDGAGPRRRPRAARRRRCR